MAYRTNNQKAWQYLLPILGFILAIALSVSIAGAAAPSGTAQAIERNSPVQVSNGKIAFDTLRSTSYQIYTMDSNGSNQINISNDINFSDSWPRWSPDGTRIVFVRAQLGNYEIYVMNGDGSNQTRLTNNSVLDDSPAWSPDGTKIAFESNRDGDYEVYVMNADGSNQTNLTNAPASGEEQPAWSPDGSKIIFSSNRDGSTDIWQMNANGSNPVQLTNGANAISNAQPAYSPDGTRIVYAQVNINLDVWVMDANGGNQTNLTNSPNSGDSNPTWSPDGTMIVFASNRTGFQLDIFTIDANGANPTNISNFPGGNDGDPSWQPIGGPTPTPTDAVAPTSTGTSTTVPATATRTNTPVSTTTSTTVLPTPTRTNTPQPTQTQGGATSTPGVATATATPIVPVCLIKFEDVGAEDWFYGYVEYLFCHQIISGYQSVPPCVEVGRTCFKPNNTTTRGQVAKIVAKAFNFPVNTSGGPHFTDVPQDSAFYNYVETLFNLGIVGGYADGTFRPDNFVTRGQIAKVVVKGAVAADPVDWQLVNPASSTFEDAPVGSAFYQYIETAAAHSILSGYPCGVAPAGACGPASKPYFMPASDAARAQISKIVFLAITWPVK